MADGATAVYGLVLPEVGASNNTWGTKLNANFEELDSLLGGTAELDGPLDLGNNDIVGVRYLEWEGNADIVSNANVRFYVDADNNTGNSFLWYAGGHPDGSPSATLVMQLPENGNLQLTGSINIDASSIPAADFDRAGSDGGVVTIRNDGTQVGSISVSGATTAYNTTSDMRLKEVEKDLSYEEALSIVNNLNVFRYHFKDHPDKSLLGLSAQDTYKVFKDAVTKGDDAEEFDQFSSERWELDPSKIVFPLIRAAQALSQYNTALEQRVAKLEEMLRDDGK